MKIIFVKKILADGSACKKCIEVQQKMEAANQMRFITDIAVADEKNPESAGMELATQYNINRAPFFIVEKESGEIEVYTIYFKLVKEVFSKLSQTAAQ